jgi:glucose/arabinose dehydrogenase
MDSKGISSLKSDATCLGFSIMIALTILTIMILCLNVYVNYCLSDGNQTGISRTKIDSILTLKLINFKDASALSLKSTVKNSHEYLRSSVTLAKNLLLNPNFTLSGVKDELPSYWTDPLNNCMKLFKCKIDMLQGLEDNVSFAISSPNNTTNRWSMIYGQYINVKPLEEYHLVTHMKLNKYAMQSHFVLEGFNETSREWYQISQCPSGTNGPLKWEEFRCAITVPENTTKIRPMLNAGWSSQAGKEAVTRFDAIYLVKSTGPFIADPNLKLQVVAQGLTLPTTMAFLGQNDFLVLEKDTGIIKRITNGKALSTPIFDATVANFDTQGLLGIAVQKNRTTTDTGLNNESTYVFIYLTAADKDGGKAIGNRLYRYELVDNRLVNPKLLLNLLPGQHHSGGKILTGPDKYLYITVGELDNGSSLSNEKSKALNNESKAADDPDGRGGILRIDQNGQPIGAHGILGDYDPLNKYYAYGIRNSFGMDFDPLTGNLWDTENGPFWGDEINLVKPGFDSGWRKVQGVWTVADGKKGAENKGALASGNPDNLVDFNGKGKYSSPEFTWKRTVAPTAMKFLTTDRLGKEYENDMFVGDANNGRIYHFKLNQNRTGLLLQGPLTDKVADNDKVLNDLTFSQGFGLITDLEIGPDDYLYVVSHDLGMIYRIMPSHLN